MFFIPWRQRLMCVLSLATLAASLCASVSDAQSNQLKGSKVTAQDAHLPSSKPKALKFEIVSIRPTPAAVTQPDEKFLPDGLVTTRRSLLQLILMAYYPALVRSRDRIQNAPTWITSDFYDVVAKVSPEDMAEWQRGTASVFDSKVLQGALQAMLEERCALVAHQIPATVSAYNLTVAKSGPRIPLTTPNEVFPPEAILRQDGFRSGLILDMDRNTSKHVYYNITLDQFATTFALPAGAPVLNKTGLIGRYDIVLKDALPLRGSEPGEAASMGPSERWNLNSLGLKLQETMIPTTTLVIDHIERPSSN
jgi:uncharacterized protein (TIGR03435 family)